MTMKIMEPEIFDVEIGGTEYTFEFSRKAIKAAEQMGVLNCESILRKYEIIFYAGLMKHKTDVTPNLAKKILYTAIGDGDNQGEYCLADFDPLVEEFTRWVQEVFGGEGQKKIVSRSAKAN